MHNQQHNRNNTIKSNSHCARNYYRCCPLLRSNFYIGSDSFNMGILKSLNCDGMKKENRNEQRIPAKYQAIICVSVFVIVFSTYWISVFLFACLGINLKSFSFFSGYRIFLISIILPGVFPVVLLGEYLTKEWKKRNFLWKSVAAGMGIIGVFICTTVLLLTMLDMFLTEVNIIWQIPLAAACNSIGLVLIASIIRSQRFKAFAKSNLGW